MSDEAGILAVAPAARPGDTVQAIDTPSLALDLAPFDANLRAMQDWADRHGVALRPHAKAHKCPQIAQRQLALGARGICCQKVSEAVPFVAAGVRDILISNEVVGPAKLALLARLAACARMSVCVDNAASLAQLSDALSRAGVEIDVLVELDVGQGRCGVADPQAALALARQARDLPGVRFAGLQAYHGGMQHRRSREERQQLSREAAAKAAACAQWLRDNGLDCPTITGGGTGSVEFDAASGVYTELQPGSYAFMDGDYGANEWSAALAFRSSLFLLSTVMSTPAPERVILDAGLKSTSAECGPPTVHGAPGLHCIAINDEHSIVSVEPGAPTPALGSMLRLQPSHVDPTFNLHDELVVFEGGLVREVWPVSARGLSR